MLFNVSLKSFDFFIFILDILKNHVEIVQDFKNFYFYFDGALIHKAKILKNIK